MRARANVQCKQRTWTVEPINARSMLDAAATAAATAADARQPPVERRRRLSPAALAVTNQKVRPAYSPIVIAGAVRLADFVLLSLVGVALYFGYVGAARRLPLGIYRVDLRHGGGRGDLLPGRRHLRGEMFRGQLRQMTRMISSWAFVFLLFIGASFLAKLGGEVSRLWLSAFFFVGLAALIAERLFAARDGAQLGASGPARPPHHHRRLRQERREAVEALKTQDDTDIARARRVRRPQRQPRAGYLRRQPETRQGRRHRRIRPPHPRRPRAVRAADLGRDPHPRDAEEAVGAAGRHPPVGPYQQAALPPPLLFLSRQGADARRVRGADHRLGPGDEMAVRPRGRRPRPARGAAGAWRWSRSRSSSTVRARCCSARSASASTTSASTSSSSARSTTTRPIRRRPRS